MNAIDKLNDASAINKAVCALIAAKNKGQELVIDDEEAFGLLLILEQMGSKIDAAKAEIKTTKKTKNLVIESPPLKNHAFQQGVSFEKVNL